MLEACEEETLRWWFANGDRREGCEDLCDERWSMRCSVLFSEEDRVENDDPTDDIEKTGECTVDQATTALDF